MRRLISITLTAALLLAAVPVAVGLLQELSRSHGVAASSSLTCSVKPSCGEGEVAVFRMSGQANAHAQTAESHPVTYGYEVCCSGPSGLGPAPTGCRGTVLELSAADNAHSASDGSYPTKATLWAPATVVDCTYGATCDPDYSCLATISGDTNAHVADCDGVDDYPTKVCCRAQADMNSDSGPPPPSGYVGAIGNGKGISGNDKTVPNGDALYDACDDDWDNDGILNASDSDPGGDITYDDNNDGTWKGTGDDGPSWDSNSNGKRDGVEGTCTTSTADADGDGLLDKWEECKWGSSATVIDSDGDTLGDCKEAADVDGNGQANLNDVVATAKAALLADAAFGKDGDFDIDGNSQVNLNDVVQEAKFGLLTGLCK